MMTDAEIGDTVISSLIDHRKRKARLKFLTYQQKPIPEGLAEQVDLTEILLSGLTEKERYVIEGVYLDRKSISTVTDGYAMRYRPDGIITERRVMQIKAEALRKLYWTMRGKTPA